MKFNKLQIFLGLAIAFVFGYIFGTFKVRVYQANYVPHFTFTNEQPPADLGNVDMTRFYTVWEKLTQLYYDKKVLDPNKMMNGAINGMVASLGDPFTLYLPPVQNTSFQQQLAGKFQGIGAELSTKDGKIIVLAPLNGSPAEKAGIKAGDQIDKVNGKSIAGMNINDVVGIIRGPKGTKVTLTVVHPDSKSETDITIVRDDIKVSSVDGWVKKVSDVSGITDPTLKQNKTQEIAYIRLSQFGNDTNQDWTKLVAKLKAQIDKDGNVKGVILDLRDNPGGYLTDATFIAGEFLPKGTPVVTEDDGVNQQTLNVDRDGQLLNIPLIVLIDGGSASASEIVSGALRDNKRAELVGLKSFGKGTVQEALDLGDGTGLHVTVAKWLTPNGTWVNKVGLTPDVVVNYDTKNPSHDAQLEKAIEILINK